MKVQVALLAVLLSVQLFGVDAHGGGKGGGSGKGKGGGGDHYGGGGYAPQPYVAHKQVVEYRPVTVHQPYVVQKPILVRPAPPPKLVHKPVVHHVQEWRLVSVPKVTYQPVYVQPIPNNGGGKKGGKGSKGGKGGKGGGGFW